MNKFKLVSDFKPAGDQPAAIKQLVEGLGAHQLPGSPDGKQAGAGHPGFRLPSPGFPLPSSHQVLLGVTGSGKTFTIANVIEKIQKPVLIISHNKTLAAQLYSEFKNFFPENAVEYFISYYDYYQPEAYIPQTDTYIEKDASINDRIDRLRLKATSSILTRRDVIVVASVSAIYNLGSPEDFKSMIVYVETGSHISRDFLLSTLAGIHYERNDVGFERGKFRVRGDTVDVFPADSNTAVRIEFWGDEISKITEINPVTGRPLPSSVFPLPSFVFYPAKHFVTPRGRLENAVAEIKRELAERIKYFKSKNLLLEVQRIEQRTNFDIEMMLAMGYCHGIENYSRHLSGRPAGSRPHCLIDYFPPDFLTIIDESHVTVPQINGMYKGDKARKETLINFGFRLPSALDNRPQKFTEFESLVQNVVYLSATPSDYELEKSHGAIVEQIVRPTGLVDPEVIIRPIDGQIDDLMSEIKKCVAKKERVLITTLTKKMAEDLADYLFEKKMRVKYLHSGIEALDRIKILNDLRKGDFDVLVGVNLLREGLDLPEVSLVAILDADKEGFLRSDTSIIQTSGRASRNVNSIVILYADKVTGSMKRAISEMDRRRKKQVSYNKAHNITPKTIIKAISEHEEFENRVKTGALALIKEDIAEYSTGKKMPELIALLKKDMEEAADNLNFELAAALRDKIFELKDMSVAKKGKKL